MSRTVRVKEEGIEWPGSLLVGSSRYTVLEPCSPGTRADVLIAVAEGAQSLANMVVVKQSHFTETHSAWLTCAAQLELSSKLEHENVVRTLDTCLETGRCCSVTEYLEGVPLGTCLERAASTGTRFSDAVVQLILLALLDAVAHAGVKATSALSRALARGPIFADDVLITYSGQVKVLGFKHLYRPVGGADPSTAVDALLARHLTPKLGALLRRLPCGSGDPAQALLEALRDDHASRSQLEGRAELSTFMCHRLGRERARQALRLSNAFCRRSGPLVPAPARVSSSDAPPMSGVRRVDGGEVEGSFPESWNARRARR